MMNVQLPNRYLGLGSFSLSADHTLHQCIKKEIREVYQYVTETSGNVCKQTLL